VAVFVRPKKQPGGSGVGLLAAFTAPNASEFRLSLSTPAVCFTPGMGRWGSPAA